MDSMLSLTNEIIDNVCKEVVTHLRNGISNNLYEIILYGSCARGDFTEDSDIDIAVILNCKRSEVERYNELFATISTNMAMKYFVVINFIGLPFDEFNGKSNWYSYYKNIKKEGVIIG